MILVDYSQVALSAILTFQRELRGDESEVKNLIRHVVLSTLKSYKKKYASEYGDIVIACDGRKYWRREVFSYYKAARKKNREQSDLDWGLIFDTLNDMRMEVAENFPYKVIHVERAEGDDIIAALAHYLQDNELIKEGIVEEPQKILILSSDKDFKQLQIYPNVRQWSPMQKKFLDASHREIMDYKIEHIVKGDSGDGVPNLLSPDDIFLQEGVRQRPISRKRLSEFLERGKDACRSEEERRNWDRNEQLVAFDKIPESVTSEIINTYLNTNVNNDKMKIMNYLMENRCRLLLDEIEDF